MQAYLHVSGEDMVAMDEMAMAYVLMKNDALRKRILKGSKQKSSTPMERMPNVDALWAKYHNDQFYVVDTSTERTAGLGKNARTLVDITKNKEAYEMVEKAKEAYSAIGIINNACETKEERFALIGRTYESVGNV
jgi:hypothetical protein